MVGRCDQRRDKMNPLSASLLGMFYHSSVLHKVYHGILHTARAVIRRRLVASPVDRSGGDSDDEYSVL